MAPQAAPDVPFARGVVFEIHIPELYRPGMSNFYFQEWMVVEIWDRLANSFTSIDHGFGMEIEDHLEQINHDDIKGAIDYRKWKRFFFWY